MLPPPQYSTKVRSLPYHIHTYKEGGIDRLDSSRGGGGVHTFVDGSPFHTTLAWTYRGANGPTCTQFHNRISSLPGAHKGDRWPDPPTIHNYFL